jgi:DNA-binding response OmpR family regulator
LLADDHEGLRESAREMMEALGYRVVSANNGLEAVQLFKANPDLFDLILLDVVMPSLSGPDAYSQMCAIRPGTKAIFASGYSAENASLKSVIEMGAPLLQKPYSMRGLSQAIRNVLARKSPQE